VVISVVGGAGELSPQFANAKLKIKLADSPKRCIEQTYQKGSGMRTKVRALLT
jgi:hypothetical protein